MSTETLLTFGLIVLLSAHYVWQKKITPQRPERASPYPTASTLTATWLWLNAPCCVAGPQA